jgi:hypothetical protein
MTPCSVTKPIYWLGRKTPQQMFGCRTTIYRSVFENVAIRELLVQGNAWFIAFLLGRDGLSYRLAWFNVAQGCGAHARAHRQE